MIDRSKMSEKMLAEFNEFEAKYAKGMAESIALFMLGAVPIIITSAIATKKIVELNILRNKYKNK